MGRGGPSEPGADAAAYAARLARESKNRVAPVTVPRPGDRGGQMLPQPYVAPAGPVRFPPNTPGLTNPQSQAPPRPAPPPPPASSSVPPPPPPPPLDPPPPPPLDPPPASSSVPPSSSAPPSSSSSSARGMSTSSIAAIVSACIAVLIILIILLLSPTLVYSRSAKSVRNQGRIRRAPWHS